MSMTRSITPHINQHRNHNFALTVVVTAFVFGSLVAGAQPGDRPPPPGGDRTPPQAAYDACVGKSADATCTVSHDDRTIDGTCRADREEADVLVCVPARPPKGEKATPKKQQKKS